MMYDSKMALAVKSSGRVLRESRDGDNTSVFLPFGCEYSLMLKNLNSLRAIVKIWIDGTDATEGIGGIIVQPNTSMDLERYIKNGNMTTGNKFKFIERTESVSNHRGNKIDDGLLRIEFEFEQRQPPRQILTTYWNTTNFSQVSGSLGGAGTYHANVRDEEMSERPRSKSARSLSSSGAPKLHKAATSIPRTDVGVTVPGALSEQKFTYGAWFPTDGVKHVMVMQLLGEIEGHEVVKPVTVDIKPQCTSCGKVNKATAKFCSECGTSLQLVGAHA